MSKSQFVASVLWLVTVTSGLTVAQGWVARQRRDAPLVLRLAAVPRATKQWDRTAFEIVADSIVARDPFRLSRQPSSVKFGAPRTGGELRPTPPLRPTLELRGLVGDGAHWRGIFAGWAGTDRAVILSAGDTLAGFRVQAVTAQGAVVRGTDTTWHLSLGAPWR